MYSNMLYKSYDIGYSNIIIKKEVMVWLKLVCV